LQIKRRAEGVFMMDRAGRKKGGDKEESHTSSVVAQGFELFTIGGSTLRGIAL
jgi:hypothetical protein